MTTTTTTQRHWLAAACLEADAAEVSPTPWRGAIQAVAGWSVATCGKAMVAVCDGGRAAESGRATPADNECRGVAKLLAAAPPSGAVGVDLGDLAEWCKYPLTPCPECKGTGKPEDEHLQNYDCFHCDGGKLDPDRNTLGWVCGGLFDRMTIRRAVVGPLAERSAVAWAGLAPPGHSARNPYPPGPARDEWQARDYRCLILHAAGELADGTPFRVLCMGVSHTPSDHMEESHRSRPTYVPGVGALWHLIEEGHGRHVVADWLQDRGLSIEAVDPLPF